MTVVLVVALAWVAASIPCGLGVAHVLRRLDAAEPPARHLQLVRP